MVPMARSTATRYLTCDARAASEPRRPARVVLAGGGVAALEAALTLHDLARDVADVTLVAVQDDFVVRAQAIGEPFGLGRARRVPLRTVALETGARFRHGRVTGVDDHSRLVLLDDDDPLPYDMVLLALGAGLTVVHPAATTWRDDDPTALAGLARQAREGMVRSVVVLVPPGPAWLLPAYELAAMLARPAAGEVEVTLVTSEERPLGAFGPTASTGVAIELQRAGVRLLTGVRAEVVPGHRPTVVLHPGGRSLQPDRIITIPRLEGRRLTACPPTRPGSSRSTTAAPCAGCTACGPPATASRSRSSMEASPPRRARSPLSRSRHWPAPTWSLDPGGRSFEACWPPAPARVCCAPLARMATGTAPPARNH